MPLADVPGLYTGRKRDRYQLAVADVTAEGLRRKDGGCEMFVKAEKRNPRTKINPDPRAITFRNPRYAVVLASMLKPLEHHVYNFAGDGRVLPKGRLIGKGLNAGGRARLLRKKWDALRDPVAIVLDAHRFDRHVSAELLELEHLLYCLLNPDPAFPRVLSWQLINYIKSRLGIIYRVHGRRMSGDMNTALGNCILMLLMVITMMRDIAAAHEYNVLDDGDDCVLLVERYLVDRVLASVHDVFLDYGMVVKVESVALKFEHLDWCQSRPVFVGGNWVLVRNPTKVLCCTLSSTKYKETGARAKLVQTVGMAEAILNRGVPVLQAFAHALIRNSTTSQYLHLDPTDDLFYRLHRELRGGQMFLQTRLPVQNEARISFQAAFGVPVDHQLRMEDALDRWSFDISSTTEIPLGLDVACWPTRSQDTPEVYRWFRV